MPVAVTMPVAVATSVVIVAAALCACDTRLVGVLLVQAMRLAVASGHPIELRGGDLPRRGLAT